jgi:hypothetical protein
LALGIQHGVEVADPRAAYNDRHTPEVMMVMIVATIRMSINAVSARLYHEARGTPSAVVVADSRWALGRTRRESDHSGRPVLRGQPVAYCGTTAIRPSSVLVLSSPGPGTSDSGRHGVRAELVASLWGCRTPLHRSVALGLPLM